MLDGVNDTPEQARELAELLGPDDFKVNLIPYNPTGMYDGSSRERHRGLQEAFSTARTCRRRCG